MRPTLRPNDLYVVTRGPLVYSLLIEEDWKRINDTVPGRELPHGDFEIYPISDWNYGLCIDEKNINSEIRFEEKDPGEYIFSPEGAPIIASLKGKKVDWQMDDGVISPSPEMDWIGDKIEEIKLIPYGCTNIRMTEMPLVEE